MNDTEARAFLVGRHQGVLVTIKRDGRPQLSNVAYALLDGAVHVSVTEDRAKTRNLRRDARVSLYVTSEDFWTYVVAEGEARLSPVAAEPGDPTTEALLRLYEAVRPEGHPDPDEFRRAMVAERRVHLSFPVDTLYPVS